MVKFKQLKYRNGKSLAKLIVGKKKKRPTIAIKVGKQRSTFFG